MSDEELAILEEAALAWADEMDGADDEYAKAIRAAVLKLRQVYGLEAA